MNRLASRSISIHIYGPRGSRGSINNLEGFDTSIHSDAPPPPTSVRPGYHILYTTINALNNDILLCVFNYYRLDDKDAWNDRLGWCKLFHVCQRWRHLIYESAFHLGMHILCTNGTPILDTLDHLPPLPLVINYQHTTVTLRGQDELGISHALRWRDRVRRIDLHLPLSVLHKVLMLMDKPFPMLEHISLSFTDDEISTLTLPKTCLAPNLRHLALLGIGLPKRLRLLSPTVTLVTLVLMNIRAPAYFRPRLLVARLQSLPQLEELSIGFSVPLPRPSFESELLGKQGNPVMLANLRYLKFRGVSAYLECLVAQIMAPLLEQLDITLYNQIAFSLPHLSHLTTITERLKFPTTTVLFGEEEVSIILGGQNLRQSDRPSILRVLCKQLDWQIDCAAQICSALTPTLSGVGQLILDSHEQMLPAKWWNGEIDGTTWHELLSSFIGVKQLRICGSLTEELSRALEVGEIGLDPGLLPGLQERVSEFIGRHEASLFGSFIQARLVAGRPVRSSFPFSHYSDPSTFSSTSRRYSDTSDSSMFLSTSLRYHDSSDPFAFSSTSPRYDDCSD